MEEMEKEKQFQMNLLRLAGKTSAVTVETMLDTISYISNHSIEDALFIEQTYLGNLFENKKFVQYCCKICSQLPNKILNQGFNKRLFISFASNQITYFRLS